MRDSLALMHHKSFSVKEKFYFARVSFLEILRVLIHVFNRSYLLVSYFFFFSASSPLLWKIFIILFHKNRQRSQLLHPKDWVTVSVETDKFNNFSTFLSLSLTTLLKMLTFLIGSWLRYFQLCSLGFFQAFDLKTYSPLNFPL